MSSAMYRGSSYAFFASSAWISARTLWSTDGMSTFRAYSLYAGMLAIMLEMMRPLRCCWCSSAYSMARTPPHE